MSNTRKLDNAIEAAERAVDAASNGQMWPLTIAEKRQVLGALAGGSFKVVRGKSTQNADQKLNRVTANIMTRLNAELTALRNEKAKVIGEAAAAKAAKKSRGWL
jgi:hypothetical protein